MSDTVEERRRGTVVGFRADHALVERLLASAAAEGLTRSQVARRALIRDLSRQDEAANG